MLKQWAAVIDDVTTIICLDAAGQIREPDEPFDTLNGQFMHPPAHIHCRAIIVPWMAGFVNKQRRPANEELARRPRKQRRKGPGGSTASNPPPDRSNPPGQKPPVPPVDPGGRRKAARDGADLRERDDAATSGPSNEGPEWEVDVRGSDEMRELLAGDAGEFQPDPAEGDPVAAEIARQTGADGPAVVGALDDEDPVLVRWTDRPEELTSSRYRVGLGLFAVGIALWILLEDDDAAVLQAYGQQQVTAQLAADARVIDLEELRALQADALAALDAEPRSAERERWRRVISDLGRFALLLGYDAIRVEHADGRVEIIVVDRSALIVEET
jgi:hypothetical protein